MFECLRDAFGPMNTAFDAPKPVRDTCTTPCFYTAAPSSAVCVRAGGERTDPAYHVVHSAHQSAEEEGARR